MKIGLVLAGGMAKGAYQVGALKALSRYINRDDVKAISSSSIGCLNSYCYASDKLDELENLWYGINDDNDGIFIADLLHSGKLDKPISLMSKEVPKVDHQYVSLVNIRTRGMKYYDVASETQAERRFTILKASVAVPLFSRSVTIDGLKYFDGATVDNVPTTRLDPNDYDLIICLYFDRACDIFGGCSEFRDKTIRICIDDGTLIKKATYITRESTAHMIKEGERYTLAVLRRIFKSNCYNQNVITDRIRDYNRIFEKEDLNLVSSSHALTTLNAVTSSIFK